MGYGIWNNLLARYPTSAAVPLTLLVPIGGIVMLVGLAIATIVLRPRTPAL